MNTWSLSRTYPTFFYVYVFMFYIRSDILSRFLHVCFKLIKVMSLNSLHSEMLRLFRGHRILLWEAMFCWVSSLWSTWSGHIYRYPIEATRLSPPPHTVCVQLAEFSWPTLILQGVQNFLISRPNHVWRQISVSRVQSTLECPELLLRPSAVTLTSATLSMLQVSASVCYTLAHLFGK